MAKRYDVTKSQSDIRSYRGLLLPNDLTVMLVHDPETEKAAAAMDVHVGHFSDPEELPGLAHFCEHMLFLGTEKYTNENEYSAFLNDHGGHSNAYTSTENTNYYFDVVNSGLEGALDRFAQFFISPLFTESATDRELTAIDNENSKNLQNDTWRAYQLTKTTSEPSFPYSKFATGNRSTLDEIPKTKGIAARDALLVFHKKYYSANLMRLVVLGKDSLDDLEAMVLRMFSEVPNYSTPRPAFPGMPYRPEHLQQMFKIVPVKDERGLDIVWQTPETNTHFKTKPANYLSHFLGHEGPGSILSVLKKRGWANELSSGGQRSSTSFSMFSVTAELTVEGLEHVDEIVSLVFQYLRMLKSGGVLQWCFDEIAQVNEINFRFKSKESAINYVSNLSSNLQLYPVEEALSGPWLSPNFDDKVIEDYLSHFTVENCRVYLTSKAFEGKTTLKERWYQTDYAVDHFAPHQVAEWSGSKPAANDRSLRLPDPNEFIPKNLELKPEPPGGIQDVPVLLSSSGAASLWFKQDSRFQRPKADVRIQLLSPVAYSSAEHCVLTQLFTLLVEDSLNEYSYSADIAGLRYQLQHSINGMYLSVAGYNEKEAVLISKILHTIRNLEVDEQRFNMLLEQTVRDYRNFYLEQPYEHAVYNDGLLLEQRKWPHSDKILAAKNICAADIKPFSTILLRRMKVLILVHGNQSESDAMSILDIVHKELAFEAPFDSETPLETRIVELQPATMHLQRLNVTNAEELNSAVEVYYQVGPESIKSEVTVEILAQLIKEPFFDQLRTKEQLGYLVAFGLKCIHGVLGFRSIVQSNAYDADYLHERVESFLPQFRQALADMTPEAFDKNRQSIISKKKEKSKSLAEETGKLWRELVNHTHQFDRDVQHIAALEALTLEEIRAFFDQHVFNKETRRMAATFMYGKNFALTADRTPPVPVYPGTTVVTSIQAAKSTLPYYPHLRG